MASTNQLGDDDQFYLFYAIDAFHHENYCQDIRHRWTLEYSCCQCEVELEFDFNYDSYEVTDPNEKMKKTNKVELPSEGARSLFTHDDYKSFVFKIADESGHRTFATWLGLMHSPFPCPNCSQSTTMFGQ